MRSMRPLPPYPCRSHDNDSAAIGLRSGSRDFQQVPVYSTASPDFSSLLFATELGSYSLIRDRVFEKGYLSRALGYIRVSYYYSMVLGVITVTS